MTSIVQSCLNAFKAALAQIRPEIAVRKALQIDTHKQQLRVLGGRTYQLRAGTRNLHLIAIGKAAVGMVQSAECVLGEYLAGGIASVPAGTQIPANLRTEFRTGAEHNLPDEAALQNANAIEQYIREVRGADQLILFLISGGGSALLPSPVAGVTLAEKTDLIHLLQKSGADIRQLNTVRTALSRLKGGGLARLAAPSPMIGLIISDIVGDPMELIASGPTVVPSPEQQKDAITVLRDLGVSDKVGKTVLDALKKRGRQERQEQEQPLDVHNVIVSSNAMMLAAMAEQLAADGIVPTIVTNTLEGDATEVGQTIAKLVMEMMALDLNGTTTIEGGKMLANFLVEHKMICADKEKTEELAQRIASTLNPKSGNGTRRRFALLFGGETTVRFNAAKIGKNSMAPMGGRNQELALAAFRQLLSNEQFLAQLSEEKKPWRRQFAIFSLGTDGQDGPTDAAGAYISNGNLPSSSSNSVDHLLERIGLALDSKCSYQFWHDFNAGANLVRTGKTGTNVMDVQIVAFEF